jgi:hypothetical protein
MRPVLVCPVKQTRVTNRNAVENADFPGEIWPEETIIERL